MLSPDGIERPKLSLMPVSTARPLTFGQLAALLPNYWGKQPFFPVRTSWIKFKE